MILFSTYLASYCHLFLKLLLDNVVLFHQRFVVVLLLTQFRLGLLNLLGRVVLAGLLQLLQPTVVDVLRFRHRRCGILHSLFVQ